MSEVEQQPDMLVSPDGESANSVGALGDSEVEELVAAGWRRIPFAQFLRETGEKLGIDPA